MRSVIVGVVLALFAKADFFEILAHLDEPWTTLGWVRVDGATWIRSSASETLGTALFSGVGCVITGIGLGFGSKFWHDMLDAVFELRGIAEGWKDRLSKDKSA